MTHKETSNTIKGVRKFVKKGFTDIEAIEFNSMNIVEIAKFCSPGKVEKRFIGAHLIYLVITDIKENRDEWVSGLKVARNDLVVRKDNKLIICESVTEITDKGYVMENLSLNKKQLSDAVNILKKSYESKIKVVVHYHIDNIKESEAIREGVVTKIAGSEGIVLSNPKMNSFIYFNEIIKVDIK